MLAEVLKLAEALPFEPKQKLEYPPFHAYPSITMKAAALLHSLVRNHALVDGNKRLGWLATVLFLDIIGHPVDLDDEEAFRLVMDTVEGKAEVEEIASRLA